MFFWLFVFFFVPMLFVVVYSFSVRTVGGGVDFTFTLENYQRFLTSGLYLEITGRSLLMAFKVTLLTLLVAYPVSSYLVTAAPGLRAFLVILLIVPWFASILVKNFAWVAILADNGVVNQLLVRSGLAKEPLSLVYNEFSVIVGMVHLLIPFMALPIFVTLEKMDKRLLEAARNLGSTPLRAFKEVTLPLSMPGVTAGCIICFILTFGAFVTPVLLGGPQNHMVANAIEDQFLMAFHWPLGAAIAIVVLVMVIGILLIFNALVGLDKIMGEDPQR
jgi:spermidine/putrescine transport system permease protein